MLLHLPDHELTVKHLLQAVLVEVSRAVPHWAVRNARPLRLKVEGLGAGSGVSRAEREGIDKDMVLCCTLFQVRGTFVCLTTYHFDK